MYPILVDGVLVGKDGKRWVVAKPYPGQRPGGIARRAQEARKKVPQEKLDRRTEWSKIYWTSFRAGQAAKREATGPADPPKRTRPKRNKKRQWLPGEHKTPAPKIKKGQGEFDL